jgi:hypothetical protein
LETSIEIDKEKEYAQASDLGPAVGPLGPNWSKPYKKPTFVRIDRNQHNAETILRENEADLSIWASASIVMS